MKGFFRGLLYALMALALAGGWAFFYWQAGAVDLAAGNAARSALNELRAIDARWNDQLIGARLSGSAGQPFTPARHGLAYSRLEAQALRLPHPEMGRALLGLRQAFAEKSAILERIAKGEQIIDEGWLAPTGPRLDAFSRVLDRAFDDALAHADLYRAWLLYYSAFLLVILLYAASELHGANARLEARVAERTRELSEALAKLKESEAMLVQSEKMSSLGQMVAGLAHEVNTPLAYAKASLEAVGAGVADMRAIAEEAGVLLELLAAERPDEARLARQFEAVGALLAAQREHKALDALGALVADGLHGIGRISELVASLKDFSRLDRSAVSNYDLHEGIESTLRIAAHQLGRRELRKAYGILPPVPCSPSQINQVLLNLVVNAAQATPEAGGVITLRTAVRGAYAAIEVADNGHGIPAEVLPKIFDPFFTTKEAGKGTGLGLAISFRIVEAHGGTLKVESKPGQGTCFTVLLPLGQPAALAA